MEETQTSVPGVPVEPAPKRLWWQHPEARAIVVALAVTALMGIFVWSTNVRAQRETTEAKLRMVDALAGAAVNVMIENNPDRAKRWCEVVVREGKLEEVVLMGRDGTELGRAGGFKPSQADPPATATAQIRVDGDRRVIIRQILLAGDNQLGVIRVVDRF